MQRMLGTGLKIRWRSRGRHQRFTVAAGSGVKAAMSMEQQLAEYFLQ
ncbi:MAG: hypothetical protein R2867_42125 [Caldilineaceae bacterium]